MLFVKQRIVQHITKSPDVILPPNDKLLCQIRGALPPSPDQIIKS